MPIEFRDYQKNIINTAVEVIQKRGLFIWQWKLEQVKHLQV